MARIKNAYVNEIMKTKKELDETRMIQVALLTLENHISDYIKEVDYFFYKEFQGLLKRSIKICGLTLTFERPTEANVALALQPTIASKEEGSSNHR